MIDYLGKDISKKWKVVVFVDDDDEIIAIHDFQGRLNIGYAKLNFLIENYHKVEKNAFFFGAQIKFICAGYNSDMFFKTRQDYIIRMTRSSFNIFMQQISDGIVKMDKNGWYYGTFVFSKIGGSLTALPWIPDKDKYNYCKVNNW